jgi:metal-sulfur cluster biosynthetic enzyme
MSETVEMKPASEEELREALMDVVDPELGIDVVNLGLIYGIHIDQEANIATVDMTLTSAACPLTDVIEDQAKSATDGLVNELRINWVWMPPWGPDKMTDASNCGRSGSTSETPRDRAVPETAAPTGAAVSGCPGPGRCVRSYTWDTCCWPEPSPPRSPGLPP